MKKEIKSLEVYEIYEAFQQARTVYGMPSLGLNVMKENQYPDFLPSHQKKGPVFFILNNTIFVPKQYCTSFMDTKDCMTHEIGHPMIAPIYIDNHLEFMDLTRKIYDNFIQEEFYHSVLNVIYDLIVNFKLTKHNKSNIMRIQQDLIVKESKGNLETKGEFIIPLLIEVGNLMLNEDRIEIKDKEVKMISKMVIEVLEKEYSTLYSKVENILNIIKRNTTEEMKKMSQDIIIIYNDTNGNGQFSTQDSMNAKDAQVLKDNISKKLMSNQGNDKKLSSRGYSKEGNIYGVSLSSYDYYIAKAKRNLRIHAPVFKYNNGKTDSAGFVIWRSDDEPDRLDIEETLSDAGIIIPEVTTLKEDYKKGSDDIGKGTPDIMVVLDTSGSMNPDKGLIALFTFLETAKFYNVKAGVMLFSSSEYYTRLPTNKYTELGTDLIKKFNSGGTDIMDAVKKLHKLNLRNTFIVMVTDWEDKNVNETAKEFAKLSKHNKICSVNFGYDTPDVKKVKKHFEVIDIQNLDELDDILIQVTERVVM